MLCLFFATKAKVDIKSNNNFDAWSNGVMLCVCMQRALLSAVAAIMEDSWAENTNNSLSLGREAQERHPVTQDHLLFT